MHFGECAHSVPRRYSCGLSRVSLSLNESFIITPGYHFILCTASHASLPNRRIMNSQYCGLNLRAGHAIALAPVIMHAMIAKAME
jgi:hypothetical protein